MRVAASIAGLAVVGLVLGAACAGPDDPESPDATVDNSVASGISEPWPLPETGNGAARALARMPQHLGSWQRTEDARGVATYDHPAGPVTLEAADVADLFTEASVSPAVAVRRLGKQFDDGVGESCMAPPYRCLLGRADGRPVMLFGRDGSRVLMVATWPDDEARDLLREAWVDAQG